MVKVSTRHDHGDEAPWDVTAVITESGDDADWDETGGSSGVSRWEAVTDGEDVFVWEGDDLVHEWKDYS